MTARVWVLLAGLLWAGAALAGEGETPRDPPVSLASLMEQMAAAPGLVARFEEERHLALLTEPLRSRGMLWFSPPRAMARVTEAPLATALLIDGDTMLFRDAEGAAPIDLSGDPTARVFLESFVVIWAGDLEALHRHHHVDFATEGDGWMLTLRPRSKRMARLVEHVRLSGRRGAVLEMEMLEKGGDTTRTRLEPMARYRAVRPEELRAAFDGQGLP